MDIYSITKRIPNLLTLINLLLGCIAIVYIYYDHLFVTIINNDATIVHNQWFDGGYHPEDLHLGKLHIAAILIFIAVLFDFMDGLAARLFNATSAVGKQLDSLADVVTFGVAPGLIMYQLIALSFVNSPAAFDYRIWLFIPAFALTLAGAYRLAVFNVDTGQSTNFKGLPIPAMALCVASLPLILFRAETLMWPVITTSWALYCITGILSLLMVSRLPIMSLKFTRGDKKGNLQRIILIAMVVGTVAIGYFVFEMLFSMVPIAIGIYILYSIIIKLTQ